MVKTAVLVSGGGTNLQALLDAQTAGALPHANLCLVVASRPEAYALTRAKTAGVDTAVISRRDFLSADAYDC
ncbi:MAG: formyltransferase family protein, partial [Ruthenibacterium sp.]